MSKTVAPTLLAALHRRGDGRVVFRDVIASAGWRVMQDDTFTVTVRPGLRLPTGGLAEGLAFTPLSTASVDPWMSADVVMGSTWMLITGVQGQAPLYKGWDDQRQGAYGRADVRGGKRIGTGVVWVGGSLVGRMKDDRGAGSFTEASATGGALWAVHKRWSINGQLRVPVWTSPHRPYDVAVGVGATWVVGKPMPAKKEETPI
ncbi:MAG: hypothetical protein AB8H79_01220 [Myxococcota bacterium]